VKSGDFETWIKPLADGSVAVGVVNLSASESMATIRASEVLPDAEVKSARDLWAHANVRFRDGAYTARIPSHGVLLLRVTAKK